MNVIEPVTEAELIQRSEYPRVTLEARDANVKQKTFYQHGFLTICVLELQNGFTVTGESACAVPENYKQDVGERIAEGNARDKIWALMGYELKTAICLAEAGTKASTPHMKTYVGTKVVHAEPMNRRNYTIFREWELPANENGDDEGYLVEYSDGGRPNVEGYNNYLSWAPKEVFEASYYEIGSFPQPKPTSFLERLNNEFTELTEKLTKLSDFIGSETYKSLDPTQQILLVSQEGAMKRYAQILDKRLDNLK